MTNEMNVDAVRPMRDLRVRLGRELAGKTFQEQRRIIRERLECAIHKLAPVCAHCGVKVIGHGIESENDFYCCAHCARQAGVKGAVDQLR